MNNDCYYQALGIIECAMDGLGLIVVYGIVGAAIGAVATIGYLVYWFLKKP